MTVASEGEHGQSQVEGLTDDPQGPLFLMFSTVRSIRLGIQAVPSNIWAIETGLRGILVSISRLIPRIIHSVRSTNAIRATTTQHNLDSGSHYPCGIFCSDPHAKSHRGD